MIVWQASQGANILLHQRDATSESLRLRRRARQGEHRRGEIDAGDAIAVGGEGEERPPGAAAEFEDRVARVRGERAIERQIVVVAAELQVVDRARSGRKSAAVISIRRSIRAASR